MTFGVNEPCHGRFSLSLSEKTAATARRATSSLEIRPLDPGSPQELGEAASILAAAFLDSPLFLMSFPSLSLRDRLLRRLFCAIIFDAVRHGRVEVAIRNEIVGLLVWYPPGAYPMSIWRILPQLRHYLVIALRSPRGVFRLFRAQRALERLRPSAPHCHGYFLGGLPGQTIGAALSRRVTAEADARQWPIYLETQSPRTRKLYQRLGFRPLRDVETLPGGPTTWTMWREPAMRHGGAGASCTNMRQNA